MCVCVCVCVCVFVPAFAEPAKKRSKLRAIPLVQFLKPALNCVRVGVAVAVRVGLCEFLQQVKGLVGYPQQELLKVQRNTVFAHELVDAAHR